MHGQVTKNVRLKQRNNFPRINEDISKDTSVEHDVSPDGKSGSPKLCKKHIDQTGYARTKDNIWNRSPTENLTGSVYEPLTNLRRLAVFNVI